MGLGLTRPKTSVALALIWCLILPPRFLSPRAICPGAARGRRRAARFGRRSRRLVIRDGGGRNRRGARAQRRAAPCLQTHWRRVSEPAGRYGPRDGPCLSASVQRTARRPSESRSSAPVQSRMAEGMSPSVKSTPRGSKCTIRTRARARGHRVKLDGLRDVPSPKASVGLFLQGVAFCQ